MTPLFGEQIPEVVEIEPAPTLATSSLLVAAPNPAQPVVRVTVLGLPQPDIRLRVMDLLGKVVVEQAITQEEPRS
jgi:hypothetical protein